MGCRWSFLLWLSLSLSRLVPKRLSSCCNHILISWFYLISSSTLAMSAAESWGVLHSIWTLELNGTTILNLGQGQIALPQGLIMQCNLHERVVHNRQEICFSSPVPMHVISSPVLVESNTTNFLSNDVPGEFLTDEDLEYISRMLAGSHPDPLNRIKPAPPCGTAKDKRYCTDPNRKIRESVYLRKG
ncbi:hypothetical protein SO802_016040 [Lithocarpus litseifolius]|uniref:Uncharacterized protein n=1 Tax=Lithocarpus litseifolius TaxID=425828 RepID=A0AAW2CXU0_9ROSI